jgi:hypothetical protein
LRNVAERAIHRLFGLAFTSDLPLPLPLDAGPATVEVVKGRVLPHGELLWQAPPPLAFACRRDKSAIVLDWPTARFRVDPERVVVDADDDRDAVALLIPVVWSVVLAGHGYEALHGCAAARDGRAVAVLGASGAGKSTAALTLIDRGWRVITDDLLALDAAGLAVPGPPFVRICPDRAAGRGGEPDAGGKFRIPAPSCPEPVPLAAIVVLDDQFDRDTPLRGAAAASALLGQIYSPIDTHPGQSRRRFELALGLVDSVPIYGAPPRSLTADRLERITEAAS